MTLSSRLVVCSVVLMSSALMMSGCEGQKKAAPADPGPGTAGIASALEGVSDKVDAIASVLPAKDPTTSAVVSTRLPDGTQYVDEVVGTGAEATVGCKASVNYSGYLLDGKKFDSNLDHGSAPFVVEPLGSAQVITGWNTGIVGMKEGGKRKLTIPSDSAYGDAGSPPRIPGKATLVFDVELLKVEKSDAKPAQQMMPQGMQMIPR
ncbi:MAG: FKBP-type peptidyl-prolyl cis-trans isomerase [Candidatus Sumerlaeales bacterium]|nr:FKBP-type peptidyl-prolyl cis-trans isomerase [Candidatus Sumerlaeales bacterium]